MKIEEFLQFFLDNPGEWGSIGSPSVDVALVMPTRRGYKARAGDCIAWGDTVEDAVEAVFDHVIRKPTKHAAIQQPMTMTGHEPQAMGYDYRTTDWTFDMPRER